VDRHFLAKASLEKSKGKVRLKKERCRVFQQDSVAFS
jgi:hypothetical protein